MTPLPHHIRAAIYAETCTYPHTFLAGSPEETSMTPHLSTDRIISIDAESNGLSGRSFAVALTLTDPTGELGHVVYRCPIDQPVGGWVAQNVLPAIEDVEENCADYNELTTQVRAQYTAWATTGTKLIAHVAWPVEARLLLDVFPDDMVWGGPYPLIDVAAVLLAHGYDPTTVDNYLKAHNVPLPPGSPHHPLYDARAAEQCLRHLLARQPVG
ncbi:hypothetical protein [Micromonospora rubida]